MPISVHYEDLAKYHDKKTYPIQNYCKMLTSKGIKGQLWIYPNQDKDHKYLPDAIYPNIKKAAKHANTRYWSNGQEYGMKDGQTYGLTENDEKTRN